MRHVYSAAAVGAVLALTAGCGPKKTFDGPTVDAFTGRVVADGKPVTFPPGEEVQLRVIHQGSAKSWGIPLQTDGTFKIGWMPIGKYTAMLERPPAGGRGGPKIYVVPDTFEIVDGKTDYTIDLGKGFKP
jgi:hypothetical protein